MQFSTPRESLLEALQKVAGAIERRSTMPILANVLLRVEDGRLILIGTDLEIELVTRIEVEGENGETTVPARKLLDICRLLPTGTPIRCTLKDGRTLETRAGRSRFSLATLPSDNYPEFMLKGEETQTRIASEALRKLLSKTLFAMAQQDVRYYLNGLLLELDGTFIRGVASDGHRLAWCEQALEQPVEELRQPIVPRKGIQELARLLEGEEETVLLRLTPHRIRVELPDVVFSAKLIDGRYPDYRRVFPQEITRVVTCERQVLKDAISRVSILSNEQYRGIRLDASENSLRLSAHNPEQEEAEEELEVLYQGSPFSVGFNAAYLADAVSHLEDDTISLSFAEQNLSCLAEDPEDPSCRFIVMPMRL